jgi:hypothetical protein
VNKRLLRGLAIVSTALAGVVPSSLVASGTAAAAPPSDRHGVTVTLKPVPGVQGVTDSKSWALTSDAHSGDCTMFHGATFTLFRDLTFSFDNTVTSSDDYDFMDMTIDPKAASTYLLGYIAYTGTTQNTFQKFLVDSDLQYHWVVDRRATAYLSQGYNYDTVQVITIHLNCHS